ncbi:DUF6850 family outer membrane beta-barrel protein [Niabella beijingensis]|uniref:DUF6850 family outer membrane beta-barrel protein n=1 Tax=Niabella beijingensis TaxID=2872700 RepID=UPI001CBAA2C6|nr:DUF6850 family outer membrane beta-barrel protein [Niabella beijingensis]MBZ4191257.1 hypothetical protein [Niabella beijingensis]
MRPGIQYVLLSAFVLSMVYGRAQNTDSIQNAVKERYSEWSEARSRYYTGPALKKWQWTQNAAQLDVSYHNSANDQFLPQKGSGRNGFLVHTASYTTNQKNRTLWGRAFYNNQTLRDVKYNETLDYDLIYPLAMVDTAGGDLKSETYFFSGGFAGQLSGMELGVSAGYRGEQAFRARDPRTKDLTSKIDLTVSASMPVSTHYQLGLDIGGFTYRQNNAVGFSSELGSATIYHDAGMGIYNLLLTGANTQAFFNATQYGAAINWVTKTEKGFLVTASYHQLNLDKRLNTRIFFTPINTVSEYMLDGSVGYILRKGSSNYLFQVSGASKRRRADEGIYDNRNTSTGYVEIGRASRYSSGYTRLGAKAILERAVANAVWSVTGQIDWVDDEYQYAIPLRKIMISQIIPGAGLNYFRSVRKSSFAINIQGRYTHNTEARYSWPDVNEESMVYAMLTDMYRSYAADGLSLKGFIRYDIPVAPKLGIYFKTAAERNRFKTFSGQAYEFWLTAGVSF